MKKWIVLVALFLLILPAAQAGIGVFGSYWDSKDYDALYGGGLKLGAELGAGFGLEARASYLSSDLFGDNSVSMNIIPLEAVLSWTLDVSEMLKPYIGAGAGYYMKSVDVEEDDFWKNTDDCVGYFALAGLNLVFGNATVFGEAKYNLMSQEDEFEWRGSDIKEKYSLDGVAINAGIKFGF